MFYYSFALEQGMHFFIYQSRSDDRYLFFTVQCRVVCLFLSFYGCCNDLLLGSPCLPCVVLCARFVFICDAAGITVGTATVCRAPSSVSAYVEVRPVDVRAALHEIQICRTGITLCDVLLEG